MEAMGDTLPVVYPARGVQGATDGGRAIRVHAGGRKYGYEGRGHW